MTFAARQIRGGKVGSATLNASYSSEATAELSKPAFGKVKVDADGNIYTWQDPPDSYQNDGAWLVTGAASDFEARMTYVSGDYWESYPAGDDATQSGNWIPITGDLVWSSSDAAGGGFLVGSFTLEIRDKYSLEIHDSASVTYSAMSTF